MVLPSKLLVELRKLLTAPNNFVKVKDDADLNKIGILIVRYVLASEAAKKKVDKGE